MPSYNQLRAAYGLAPKLTFTSVTGEATEALPAGLNINDPRIMDFVELRDANGALIQPGTDAAENDVITAIRRTTTAARLKAIYGNTGNLDAFTGMLSERHVAGTEFGELQLAIWKREFERLRDGDRFFYANDPNLDLIRVTFGIDFRRTLSQVITDNTELNPGDIAANVFKLPAG
jgi:hypothetical protein